MRKIIVQENQSIMDIALQEYGNVEAAEWIVADNQSVDSIVDNLEYGIALNIRNEPMDSTIKQALKNNRIATMDTNSLADGIGFEGIERQLKVY